MRPLLRPVEVIRVASQGGGLVTWLRDPERIATRAVEVRPPLDAALRLLDGRRDLDGVLTAMRERGVEVERARLLALLSELEETAMLDGPRFRARRAELVAAFTAARVREPTHAGGAYHGRADALRAFLEDEVLGHPGEDVAAGPVVGLVAPHMDLWRAAGGYGHAYRALRAALPAHLDTVVVLGTCHAGMRTAFCATKKAFATPLGELQADEDLLGELARASEEDLFEEEYKHKGEHSIEFQCVLLRHVLGAERAAHVRIVPVLCGLGQAQAKRSDPARDRVAERFLGGLAEAVSRRRGRVLVVAGADLAHVGPRFGDVRALDPEGRARLAARDRESVEIAARVAAPGFFEHVTEDLGSRRVCGTGPVYTLLRALEALSVGGGTVLSYEQQIDPDEGSIVSHASIAFRETSTDAALHAAARPAATAK